MIENRVVVGKDVVTIFPENSSSPLVVGLLGVDTNEQGVPTHLYLDSLIHGVNEEFLGWHAFGAISTILVKL